MGTGSAASLIDWDEIGRAGREYHRRRARPQAEIAGFLGRPAMTPIRVYVGLNTADDPGRAGRARARRADPGRRLRPLGAGGGGADRHRLDGPGGDRHAGISARRRHRDRRGAVFLPDQPALDPVEPGFSVETGPGAVPRDLPPLDRAAQGPAGRGSISTGSASAPTARSSRSACYEVLADPFNGALWTGPPFSTPQWRRGDRRAQPRLARMAADASATAR